MVKGNIKQQPLVFVKFKRKNSVWKKIHNIFYRPCKHPIENIVIHDIQSSNYVNSYCSKCYSTITFMPKEIHYILEDITNL